MISWVIYLLLAFFSLSNADESTHVYDSSTAEPVIVWLQSVTPFHNPNEVYSLYDDLPICRPTRLVGTPSFRPPSLGELIIGHSLENSDIKVQFKKSVKNQYLCSMSLTRDNVDDLAFAVSNHYLVSYLIDDLPAYAMLGETDVSQEKYDAEHKDTKGPHEIAKSSFVFTHRKFTIGYNGDRIVSVSVSVDSPVLIEADRKFEFTYSVEWVPDDTPFENRFDRYTANDDNTIQVRWFGVINSALMAVFLCGTVALILLKTLRADFSRYLGDEDEEEGLVDKSILDESGWKQISGDVFRRPNGVVVFSALFGVGVQLLFLTILVVLISFFGSLHVDRGAINKAALFGYALTSAASGFVSGGFYRSLYPGESSPHWIRVMILSCILVPGSCVAIALLLSFFAISYGTNSYVSPIGLLQLIAVWLFLSVPMTIGGTILGRRFGFFATVPFRVNHVPRPIPVQKWYFRRSSLVLATGLFPFASVFIELFYVVNSFWGHSIYAAWLLILVALMILILVVSCVSIVSVYLLLASEDYRWQWHAFASGASVALYVFAYAVYFFFFKTEMTGLLQTAYYFSYSALACLVLGTMIGSVSVFCSNLFVRAIYSSVKND